MGRGPASLHVRRLGLLGLTSCVIGLSYLPNASVPPAQTALAGDIEAPPAQQGVRLSDTLALTGLQERFEEIAKGVSPAVVAISASVADTNSDDALRAEEMNGPKLEHILDRVVRTVGTGFVIDADGFVLTNEHVVGGSECLWVTSDSGKVYPAVVIGSDPRADLAVLKIPATGLPTVKFAPNDSVKRGEWTIALGNPYGLAGAGEMSMSVGVVSALDRSLPKLASKEGRLYSNLIQTTAEINPGNSGGPLFDIEGQVIGVNTAVILPQKQTNGIGFAMPITQRTRQVIAQLKQGEEISYGYMGVTVVTPTEKERRDAGIEGEIGARVDSVEANSPATVAEIQPNDLVTEINGQMVRDGDQFVRLVGETSTKTPARMTLSRDGKLMTVSVKLTQRELPTVAVTRESQRLRWRGMLLGPVPAHWSDGKERVAEEGGGLMVLAVEKGSPAAKMGIAEGAVIRNVAGRVVTSVTELQKVLNDTPSELCKFQAENPAPVIASTSEPGR